MRKANIHDMFNISRLIGELGLKEELYNSQTGIDDVEKIGFNFIYNMFEKATTVNAESRIYEVLSGPFEMDVEELKIMEIDKFIETFMKCFNVKTLVNFIKRAGMMMN